jgi:hypothetical protein
MIRYAHFLFLVLLSGSAFGQDSTFFIKRNLNSSLIQSYEPNTIGLTKDDDDVGFMEFKVSVKSPIVFEYFYWLYEKSGGFTPFPYFAFTGRFGQYIGTRNSSPVIGKRFNPKLFFLFNVKQSYLESFEVSIGHESNGQKVDSLNTFNDLASDEEKPQYAYDYLSRGWDYVELNSKFNYEASFPYMLDVEQYLSFKYFLPYGPMQGKPEEYNLWENNPEGKIRSEVNGIYLLSKLTASSVMHVKNAENVIIKYGIKYALILETGYTKPFKFVSQRHELTLNLLGFPMMVYYSNGYNSDLAQYFKRVESWGIALELM